MDTLKLLKVVNPILALAFVIQAVTGVLFAFDVNVPEFFYALHKYSGVAMVLAACCHIYLNWGWIKAHILNI